MTAPLLATRDALAEGIESALARFAWEPGWRNGDNSQVVSLTDVRDHLADRLLASGVVRDPATLANDEALVIRTMQGSFCHLRKHQVQSALTALAAAFTEDPA